MEKRRKEVRRMKILITGATGFIGRALVLRLRRDGHRIRVWVRDVEGARMRLGDEVTYLEAGTTRLEAALDGVDAVVNLAGEPLFGRRWTARRRAELVSSRVEMTEELVKAMAKRTDPPRVLVSASAVGFYGDQKDAVLDESSPPGEDFLADLCLRWERAALGAENLGTRVVLLRTGIVLGREGGALAQLLPPFRLGLGGPIGRGRHYQPWIHLHDVVEAIATATTDPRYIGPINVTAPTPVTNRDLARHLGRALGRPAFVPVPPVALRLLFGASSEVVLASQRALPRRLEDLGFDFAHRTLASALEDILGEDAIAIRPFGDESPTPLSSRSGEPSYLADRRPRHVLATRARLVAPVDEVFAFFSKAENLGLMTPAGMRFRIEAVPERMGEGVIIRYRLRVGPLPIRWQTRIARWDDRAHFVDAQISGPYRAWWHEHHFRADGEETVMDDRVYYALPFGLLGRLVHRLFVAGALRRIFKHRLDGIRLRFGGRSGQAPRDTTRPRAA
jgi:uncharacterized protein